MVGSANVASKKALLQESLDTLRQNVEYVGDIKTVKEKYPKAYSKLIKMINEDTKNLRDAIFIGYRYDDSVLAEEDFACMVDPEYKGRLHAAIKVNFSATEVESIFTEFITRILSAWGELIRLDPPTEADKSPVMPEGIKMYERSNA